MAEFTPLQRISPPRSAELEQRKRLLKRTTYVKMKASSAIFYIYFHVQRIHLNGFLPHL